MNYKLLIGTLLCLLLVGSVQAVTWAESNGCWTATNGTYNLVMWNATGTSSWQVPPVASNIEYLIVGGGGQGGHQYYSGGGGAGEIANGTLTGMSGTKFVTVGAGGYGAYNTAVAGTNGGSSVFDTITAIGGGGGGSYNSDTFMVGSDGGSGGGGSANQNGGTKSGLYLGTAGAKSGIARKGGGGGGAWANGSGFNGGIGTNFYSGTFSIVSNAGFLSGGGGGSAQTLGGGTGGSGIGGHGGDNNINGGLAGNGVVNTGSGGGGSDGAAAPESRGGSGGSGIVIIRYLSTPTPVASFSSVNRSIATNTTARGWEGIAPFTMQFTNTSTNPPHTSWVWNYTALGSSTPVTFNQTTYPNPIYTFTPAGNYSIQLNVTGTYGTNISTQKTFVNVSLGISADFLGFSLDYCPPMTVYFVDYSTGDDIYSWNWNFGDGNTSIERNPTHVYNMTGSFNVSLAVTGSGGSNTLTRNNYISSVTCIPPSATPGTGEQWCGLQQLYFQHDNATHPAGYEQLINYPSGNTEVLETVTLKQSYGYVPIDSYITPENFPNVNLIQNGLRTYNAYHSVDTASGTTIVNYTVFKRNLTGYETYLYSLETADINDLATALISTQYVLQSNITMGFTDRLVVKIYGKTTHPANIVLSFRYQGSTHTSHIDSGYFVCIPAIAPAPTTTGPTTVPTTAPPTGPTTRAIPNIPVGTKEFVMPWWGWGLLGVIVILILIRRR